MSYEYNPISLGVKATRVLATSQPTPGCAPHFQLTPLRSNSSSLQVPVTTVPSTSVPLSLQSYTDTADRRTDSHISHRPLSPVKVTNLSKIMDQVSPPNVVIGSHSSTGSLSLHRPLSASSVELVSPRLNAASSAVGLDYLEASGSKYRSLLGGSSSPEPEETRKEGKSEAPPNRTISFESKEWSSWENTVQRNLMAQARPSSLPFQGPPFQPQNRMPDRDGAAFHVSSQWEHSSKQQVPPVGFNAADIKRFAENFQFSRIKAGFSYTDVVKALGSLYGTDIDEFTLRKFEELNLPVSQAIRLKPHLEKWLLSHSFTSGQNNPIEISSRTSSDSETEQKKVSYGRKRTKIDSKSKAYMESYFKHSQKPSYEELIAISSNTGLDRDVVRVWFSNRRQKERRQRNVEEVDMTTAAVPITITASKSPGLENWFSSPAPGASGSSSYEPFGLQAEGAPAKAGPREDSAIDASASGGNAQSPSHLFSLGENPWSSKPVLGFVVPSLEHSVAEMCSTAGQTSVIVSRKAQQQQHQQQQHLHQQQEKPVVKEQLSSRSSGFENTFLMTPKVEETAERSDEDWSTCY
jgi:hypothetical protein